MKISIITVTFNSERTLKETFESILIQKHRPLQYIVIDGKSNDHTLDIIGIYKDKFIECGIEFICISEKDNGISDAFNKGIGKAEGEIIGIINSDDKLVADALTIIEKEYQPEIEVYYGDCVIFKDICTKEHIAVPKMDLELLKIAMAIFHPSTFISRYAYDKYGLYDVDLKYCMDRELFLRMYKNNAIFKYIHAPLACYREGGINQIHDKECSLENMKVSIKYGMHPIKAYLLRGYLNLHARLWKIIQKLGIERVFHKKYKDI